MEPPEVVEVGDERRLAFDINLRHTWVAPLFVKLVWSASGFEAKGRITNRRVMAIVTKKDPFELDSASLMGFNGRRGWKLAGAASGFGKKSMISGHCTKKDPFDFMYGGFFILAQVAV